MARLPPVAWAAGVCVLITATTFAPAVGAPLLQWDDHANLVANTRWQGFSVETVRWAFTTFHLGPWQPLSWLSFTLDHALWGADPRGLHATNVILQSVCAALLCLVAHRLLPRAVPGLSSRAGLLAALAAAASLLWAVHPQRVESVAWVTERRDVLSCAFLLASTLAWIRHTDLDAAADARPWFRRGAWWASFALYAASLLSKATAMGFVLVLVLLDLHPFRRPLPGRNIAEKVPFGVAGACIAVLAWMGQRSDATAASLDDVPLLARVVVAGATAFHHLAVTGIPVGLRAHHQRPTGDGLLRADLVAAAVAAVVLFAAVAALRRRFPSSAIALGTYVVLLAPVSGLTLTGAHLFADRYSHQPTLGLGLLAAGAAGTLLLRSPQPVKPGVLVAALGAATFVLATSAFELTSTWRSPRTLWGRVLEFEPENWVAHEQLAKAAYDAGDRVAAEEHLVRSLRSWPGRKLAPVFLAIVRLELGRIDDAEATIASVLKWYPDDPGALRARGRIRAARGDVEGAIANYRRAVQLAPENADALREYGVILSSSGRRDEAEVVARRTVDLCPSSATARVFLGSLVQERGDMAGAERLFREAVALEPRNAPALQWLGSLLADTKRPDEAEPVLRAAVEADPSFGETWATLSTVVASRGDLAEAAALAVRAADLAPREAGPRLQAAALYLAAGRKDEARAQATAARDLATRAGDAATARRAAQMLARIDAK